MNWREGSRRMLPYLIAAAAGFLLAYLVVAFVVFPARLIPNDSRVPNVVGRNVDDAARELTSAGFRVTTERHFHRSAPKNTVLQQAPPSGSREPKGTPVTLDVSAGQRTATVPNVVGMTRQLAEVAVANAGLDLGAVTDRTSREPRGEVLASTPAPGEMATLPSRVDLVVSSGPSAVAAPDVVGRTLPQARAMLEQAGLQAGDVRVDSASIETPSTVIAQQPAAGRRMVPGARVNLTVAP